jgi:flagellar hook-basal body complex protein FliE
LIESIGKGLFASVAMSSHIASPFASGSAAPPAPAGAGFGSILENMISSTVASLKQGEAAAIAGIQGTMPVQQAVDQVLQAERTLQAAIAIRDKLAGAYLEINRLQI